ncbi:L,D-transpeptidase family protein [Microbacterium indicum]|uniref:L,D-transpeptidase family protein n=1 Tax=Microbacterium indicum TaxID=358100 RepID=UPI0004124D5B|nr:L,D-transpeptidase family protein [Microbacterium indicum]
MTDLATKPVDTASAGDSSQTVEWAQPEPKKSHKKLWLGIGIPGGVVVAAAAAAGVLSTMVIAPGTTVLGADVGLSFPGSTHDRISEALASLPIDITVDGETAQLTGSDLGLSVDASTAAADALSERPAWKVGEWNGGDTGADVTVDEAAASAALSDAFADAYTDPVNAQIQYSDGSYQAVAGQSGRGVDTTALAADIEQQLAASNGSQALASGTQLLAAADSSSGITIDTSFVEIQPLFTTNDAEAEAQRLNGLLTGVSFSLDGDDVDTAPADTVASWLDVTVGDDGTVSVATDDAAIQSYVDGLPAKVDQDATDADVIVNAAGDVLKTETEGQDGYKVSSTDGVADQVAAALTQGESADIALTGEVVEHKTTERFRRAYVDISEGMSYFYETVNGGEEKLVRTIPSATGTAGHDTQTGNFTVYAQLTSQNMGSCDADGNYDPTRGGKDFGYCTANVPWISYFNGDQGFHGTYWHNNFGNGARMSHGCVNLPEAEAQWTYSFLQVGTPVQVVS